MDNVVFCRHDFWRAAYLTMLAEFTPEMILEYFSTRPMELEGRTLLGGDLLEHLWKAKGLITMDWNYAGVETLEAFLVKHGRDPVDFMRKLLFRNNRATYMPGKVVLSWFYPIMENVFRNYDPRVMVFGLIAVFTETYLPGHIHRRIKKEVIGDWIHSYLLYATDKKFKLIRKFNFDLIAGEQIKAAPRVIDLPEFEDISYLSECHTLEEMVWKGDCLRQGDVFLLDGNVIGRKTRFRDFARDLNLPIGKFKVPDTEVYVADRDVSCPVRNRIIIYSGCAYGAPCYISVVKHRKTEKTERKYLKHLIADAMLEEDALAPEIEWRHQDLLNQARNVARFVWFEADQSIALNGEHVVKGISARILRNILFAFTREGRNEFEYREFKRDFEINMGQKNSNFEVRFYRLIEKLEEKCPEFKIEKLERGRFSIKADCSVQFHER